MAITLVDKAGEETRSVEDHRSDIHDRSLELKHVASLLDLMVEHYLPTDTSEEARAWLTVGYLARQIESLSDEIGAECEGIELLEMARRRGGAA